MTARKTQLVGARRPPGPIRTAVIRGLTVVMPPLLTIVIFFWIAGTINVYVLEPLTGLARDVIVWSIADVRTVEQLPKSEREGQEQLGDLDPKSARQVQQRLLYQNIANGGKGKYIPASVYAFVKGHDRVESMPGWSDLVGTGWRRPLRR